MEEAQEFPVYESESDMGRAEVSEASETPSTCNSQIYLTPALGSSLTRGSATGRETLLLSLSNTLG